jgi:HAMP domain-containing protein
MPDWKPQIRLGLQARLTIWTVLSLLGVFVIMGFIGLRNQAASLDVLLEQRLALAQTIAVHVDYHIGYMLAELDEVTLEEGFDLTDNNLEPERKALAELYQNGLFTYDVFVTDAHGIVLAVEPKTIRPDIVGTDFSKHPHIREALETGQPQVSGVIPGVAASGAIVSLVVPVKNNTGETVGLIGGSLDSASTAIAGFIAPSALGETGYAQVLDGNGMVITSTLPGAAGAPSRHRDLVLPLIQNGQPVVVPDSLVMENEKEIQEVTVFAPIPSLGWGVTVEQERAEALAPVIQARNQIMVVAVVTMVVAMFIIWFTTRQITHPALVIAEAARRVANGDFNTLLPKFGSDEIGQLGRDFEAMRERLRESHQLQEHWNAELEQKVEERTRQIIGLQEATRRLTANLSLEVTLDAIVEESRKLFGADRCAVYVLDSDTDELICLARHGLSLEYVEAVCLNFMRLPGGIARAMAKPVVVPDAQSDPRMAPVSELVQREGFRTLLILPFVHHGEVTGAFGLYHDQAHEYTPDEVSLGEAFAAQAASAVVHAQVHDALQRELFERKRAEQQLQERMSELERFNRLAVGRELKMAELKERIRQLENGEEAKS